MKTYKITDLKRLAAEQGYKLAALENSQGVRILPFNQIKKSITLQLDKIPIRLKSELQDDGVYWVLMAHSINTAKNPDRYPIVKGKVNPEDLKEAEKKTMPLTPTVEIVTKSQEVLTWDAALEMQKKMSALEIENAILKDKVNKLEIEIEEYESDDEQGALNEQPSTSQNIFKFLGESITGLTPVLDRYFDLQERKLKLEELRVQQKPSVKRPVKQGIKPIVAGTQEHLNLIEHYFNQNNDEKLFAELDKLEEVNPELYKAVCEKLQIEEEEEGGGNDGQ